MIAKIISDSIIKLLREKTLQTSDYNFNSKNNILLHLYSSEFR